MTPNIPNVSGVCSLPNWVDKGELRPQSLRHKLALRPRRLKMKPRGNVTP